eukprot:8151882-Lingulodinium_polyedra.AAC.1
MMRRVCGGLLDTKCRHAGCCAGGENAKGRDALVRQLYTVARTFDPTTAEEEADPGGEKLRPGDV